ncbi:hypothetical protein SGCOL_008708 [Colletotrichum sp. CLE4]
MPSTPSTNSAAAARSSNTFALVFLMLMVFTLTFGASMVQVSIQGYLRQVVCRQQYGLPEKTPIENGLCHTDAVDKQLEWVQVVAQVCQSAGGLLSAYPLGKRSDTKGRRGSFISGACLWGLFSGILVTSVQISSWGVIWFLFFAIGAGKTCVEVAVLAMTSDTTDDRQRSKHFGLVIFSALTGLVVSNVIHRYAPPMALEFAALIGCVAFCVGTTFIVAFPELLYAQHEAFRGEPSPEIFSANQAAVRPLYRVVSTLITYRALPLLAILSLVLTLARTLPSSLDFYFAARYIPTGGLDLLPRPTKDFSKHLHRKPLQAINRQDQVHHTQVLVVLVLGPGRQRRLVLLCRDVGEARLPDAGLVSRARGRVTPNGPDGGQKGLVPLVRGVVLGVAAILGVEFRVHV